MKTEKELTDLASAIAEVLSQKECNAADVFVIIGMMQHDLFYMLDKASDRKSAIRKVEQPVKVKVD